MNTMKAATHYSYGPPEVVSIRQVPRPLPKDNEVLVKVYVSTVNRTDCGFRSASYFVSRFWSGLFKPNRPILGCEFAGVVEELGRSVTGFKIGDRIFGYDDQRFGGHAEYLTIPETGMVAQIPDGLDFPDAAPITEGSHYALNIIRASKIKAGEQALVYGATGAIGSAAVQLLRHLGVRVTAVCNTKNVSLVSSLGAERVIDYQTEDFTRLPDRFPFIFDAVGKSSFGQCKPLLTEKGVYISTELGKGAENVFLAIIGKLRGGKRVLFPIPENKREDILYLKELVESGAFKPVIDRRYPLDQIVEAYSYVETEQKTGNILLGIADQANQ
jgi:NADPH:quinone reductase-like Zn-dependent oxidoreductase